MPNWTIDYCICGSCFKMRHSSLFGELTEDEQIIFSQWQALHSGDGHKSCSAAEANKEWNIQRSRMEYEKFRARLKENQTNQLQAIRAR